MFGFQRIGDFCWAAGDMQARGFLIGGTAGRTTLAGEGLQHQDGHSQLVATTIPNCVAYDPTYAYELAVIVQDGLRRMYAEQQNVFYYITCMNENYAHPALPEGAAAGILRGPVPAAHRQAAARCASTCSVPARSCAKCSRRRSCSRRISACRPTCSASRASRSCGARRSTPSAGTCCIPASLARTPYVRECLGGPHRAVHCGHRLHAHGAGPDPPVGAGRYHVLGTDGYGRSDSRAALRGFFEVDRRYIAVAALKALADEGALDLATVKGAIDAFRHRSGQAESGHGLAARAWQSSVEIRVPDLGDYKDVEIIDVAVKAGDTIALEGAVVTLETEKATLDVPSTVGRHRPRAQGQARRSRIERRPARARSSRRSRRRRPRRRRLLRPHRPRRRTAQQTAAQRSHGDARARRARPARAQPGAEKEQRRRRTSPSARACPSIDEPGFSRSHASPSVRRFARELGADLARIKGSGPKGRITADDVKALCQTLLTAPAQDGRSRAAGCAQGRLTRRSARSSASR